jgi:hypothetical protein
MDACEVVGTAQTSLLAELPLDESKTFRSDASVGEYSTANAMGDMSMQNGEFASRAEKLARPLSQPLAQVGVPRNPLFNTEFAGEFAEFHEPLVGVFELVKTLRPRCNGKLPTSR